MRIKPLIETKRLTLRLAELDDLTSILQFYRENRDHFSPWWPEWEADFFTENYWSKRIVRELQQFEVGAAVRLSVFHKTYSSRIIGLTGFSNVVRGAAQFCNLGYGMDFREEGKGLMTEAVGAGIDYLFSEWNLHRIQAAYIPHNRASGRVLKRLDFVVDGYARDYLRINGEWQDHILMSLTNRNWFSNFDFSSLSEHRSSLDTR